MSRVNYVLVNKEFLPEIYSKVLLAKRLIASGEVGSAKEASALAGISRTTYYRYKDAIFEYGVGSNDEIATIKAKLHDSAGVLSSFMAELYKAGANVLSVNQSMPENGVADVSVTVRVADMTINVEKLVKNLNDINGINSAEITK